MLTGFHFAQKHVLRTTDLRSMDDFVSLGALCGLSVALLWRCLAAAGLGVLHLLGASIFEGDSDCCGTCTVLSPSCPLPSSLMLHLPDRS